MQVRASLGDLCLLSRYATTGAIVEHAKKLATALTEDGLTFDNSSFIYAQYDTPAHMRHRHNEIWFTECGHDDAFVMPAGGVMTA